MSSHPNRGRKKRGSSPPSKEIAEVRQKAGLNQAQLGYLIYATERAVQSWEAPSASESSRRMHPAMWELLRLKLSLWESCRAWGNTWEQFLPILHDQENLGLEHRLTFRRESKNGSR